MLCRQYTTGFMKMASRNLIRELERTLGKKVVSQFEFGFMV